ncbi:hypothetical protein FRX31_020091 [Thalictrum thalictroides]|uniref:Uncharacterized protein n=1 Tax=Thalictrum thalictroides TaxID=46969 RepID=A0A7J6VZP5_THATH|nr:hypothetical protein FRX31_020091 [Thalictrum thalictroides]
MLIAQVKLYSFKISRNFRTCSKSQPTFSEVVLLSLEKGKEVTPGSSATNEDELAVWLLLAMLKVSGAM